MKIKNKYILLLLVFLLIALSILFINQDIFNTRHENSNPNSYDSDTAKIDKPKSKDQFADQMPQLINQAMPKYPKKGLIENLECIVYIRVYVDKNGNPVKSEIMKREGGIKEFEDSVTVSAMNSKFSPAKIKGDPVEAWVVIPYRFKLK